jgi:hypothetical protein
MRAAAHCLISVPTGTLGPSIVVRVAGANLPWLGTYQVTTKLLDSSGASIDSLTVDPLNLLPTKDLIVGMDIANGISASDGPWQVHIVTPVLFRPQVVFATGNAPLHLPRSAIESAVARPDIHRDRGDAINGHGG